MGQSPPGGQRAAPFTPKKASSEAEMKSRPELRRLHQEQRLAFPRTKLSRCLDVHLTSKPKAVLLFPLSFLFFFCFFSPIFRGEVLLRIDPQTHVRQAFNHILIYDYVTS